MIDALFTVYIDAGAGSDSNSGLTRGAPIQTWAKLNTIRDGYALQAAPFVIRVLGTSPLDIGLLHKIRTVGSNARTWLICEQETVVASGTTSGASSDGLTIPISGLTADGVRGLTLKIAGKRRTILTNTTTSVRVGNSVGAQAGGVAYQITKPAVELRVGSADYQVVPTLYEIGDSLQVNPLILWNCRISSAHGYVQHEWSGSSIHMFGVSTGATAGVQVQRGAFTAGDPAGTFRYFGTTVATAQGWFDADVPDLGVTVADITGWGFGCMDAANTYGYAWYSIGNATLAGYAAFEYLTAYGSAGADLTSCSVASSFDLYTDCFFGAAEMLAPALQYTCSANDRAVLSIGGAIDANPNAVGYGLSLARSARAYFWGYQGPLRWRGPVTVSDDSVLVLLDYSYVPLTLEAATALTVIGGRAHFRSQCILTGTAGYGLDLRGGDVWTSAAPGTDWTGTTAATRIGGTNHPTSDLAGSFAAVVQGASRIARTS